jgi:hypothetical protein
MSRKSGGSPGSCCQDQAVHNHLGRPRQRRALRQLPEQGPAARSEAKVLQSGHSRVMSLRSIQDAVAAGALPNQRTEAKNRVQRAQPDDGARRANLRPDPLIRELRGATGVAYLRNEVPSLLGPEALTPPDRPLEAPYSSRRASDIGRFALRAICTMRRCGYAPRSGGRIAPAAA